MAEKKLITFCVPCYNSQDYMEKCIDSLLIGEDKAEILIIDDGSTDRTAQIADRYEAEYPGICRAVHKPNGGHGSGVNKGIELASGIFYKVVDSDDWLEKNAYLKVLEKLDELTSASLSLDMMVCNYTYAKEGVKNPKVISYAASLPQNKIFNWNNAHRFMKGKYILMHSVIYRTEMLRASGLKLPEHCFYVDNLYVFAPLPYVNDIYYLNVDLYQYYIGRADQSVNEQVMISRLDQQHLVTRLMVDYYSDHISSGRMRMYRPLRRYMFNYLEIIVAVSSILAFVSGTPEHIRMKDDLWNYIEQRDSRLYAKLKRGIIGQLLKSDAKNWRKFSVKIYKMINHIFNFN